MLADASRHLDDYLAPYQLSGDRGPLAATSSDVSIRPGTDHSDHQAQHVLVPSDCDHPVYHQNAECWSAEPAALRLLRRDRGNPICDLRSDHCADSPGQPIPADPDVQHLHGGLWQSTAMAFGFAISIPLYFVIGQVAFAVWAAVPITANLIKPFLRGRHAKVA